MKAKLFFITIFAAADAFLGAFAVGFNSRHALIGDPTIPAPKIEKSVQAPTNTPVAGTVKGTDKTDAAKPDAKSKAANTAAAKKSAPADTDKDKKGKGSKKAESGKPSAKAEKSKTPSKGSESKKHDAKSGKSAK